MIPNTKAGASRRNFCTINIKGIMLDRMPAYIFVRYPQGHEILLLTYSVFINSFDLLVHFIEALAYILLAVFEG